MGVWGGGLVLHYGRFGGALWELGGTVVHYGKFGGTMGARRHCGPPKQVRALWELESTVVHYGRLRGTMRPCERLGDLQLIRSPVGGRPQPGSWPQPSG